MQSAIVISWGAAITYVAGVISGFILSTAPESGPLRGAIQVREILPNIVRSEVGSYLGTLFATGRGRRRQRT
jgi:hypothetical protein